MSIVSVGSLELETSPPAPRVEGTGAFPGPVLLAIEDREASHGAVDTALCLARQRKAHLRVLSVVEPNSRDRATTMKRRVARLSGAIGDAELEVREGCAVHAIVSAADECEASLILLGLRTPAEAAKVPLRRDDTTLRVMRRASMPVLAIPSSTRGLARTAIVAVDFTRSSLRAARAAISLVDDGGSVILAHVAPLLPETADSMEGLRCIYSQGVGSAFARLVRELEVPPSVHVSVAVLEGMPATEIRSLIDRSGADLLALGTHRYDFGGPPSVGRLTTGFVRAAPCALLVAPPPPRSLNGPRIEIDHLSDARVVTTTWRS